MTDRTPHGTHHRDEIARDVAEAIARLKEIFTEQTPVAPQPAPEGHEPAESEFA